LLGFLAFALITPWTYVSIDVAIATGVVALVRVLPRRQQWLLVACVPMLMLAGHAMTAFPSALAMHSTDDDLLLHLGALGTGAFALVLSHVCSLAFRTPPARAHAAVAAQEPRKLAVVSEQPSRDPATVSVTHLMLSRGPDAARVSDAEGAVDDVAI